MATVMLYQPTNDIAPITQYALCAEARAGDAETPQQVLGTPTNAAAQALQWYDVDNEGGLNTATVGVSIDVNLNTGQDSFQLGNAAPSLTFDGPSGQTVDDVLLVSGVQVGAKVSWSNVQVQFLQAGVVQETVNVGTGPIVDTRSTGDPEEQIESIVPASTADDEVIITGNIKMLAPDGTYPGPDDLFAQAFVDANA